MPITIVITVLEPYLTLFPREIFLNTPIVVPLKPQLLPIVNIE